MPVFVGSSNALRKVFATSKRQLFTTTHRPQSQRRGRYNNLGINLILMGQWARAQEALRVPFLPQEADERAEKVPMILDSLGELLMLRGELDEPGTSSACSRPRYRGR